MAVTINPNVTSMVAQRNLNRVQDNLPVPSANGSNVLDGSVAIPVGANNFANDQITVTLTDATTTTLAIDLNDITTAARSLIVDVDIAAETSELAKNSVLTQAGTAMLAQANGIPTLALSLLS